MATRRIQEFLDGNHMHYAVLQHSPAYTASQVADSVHIPGKSLAKVVVIDINHQLALAVVSAVRDVDLSLIQHVTGILDVRLAVEDEFVDRFEGCQLGAVPPFGHLFGIDTYVEARLLDQPFIAFNAGTHRDVILMNSTDYLRLAVPIVTHIDTELLCEKFNALSV